MKKTLKKRKKVYNNVMGQKRKTDFSTAAEIIKTLGLTFNADYENQVNFLLNQWSEIVGANISKYSEATELTEDGIMMIRCKNSVVANEIFGLRTKINAEIKQRAKKANVNCFKYIKIVYN